jgi:ketosteroid isomerase-like protein
MHFMGQILPRQAGPRTGSQIVNSLARQTLPHAEPDAEIVRAYLEASMAPDPDRAATYMLPGTKITFTGGRVFDHPRGPTGFNAGRYRWVKKRMDRFDVCPGEDETVVYSVGTLYGEWPDGTPFEGNRYVDRFVVREGKIVAMDVWNDSAERILTRKGIEA